MKTLVTMTIDAEVIERHRKAGHNVSKLCNDFLAGYFKDCKPALMEQAKQEFQTALTIINKAVKTQDINTALTQLLREANKARASGQEFKHYLEGAQKLTGMSWSELVAKMERV